MVPIAFPPPNPVLVATPILARMERLGLLGALALSTLALHGQQQNPYNFSTQTDLVTVPTQVTTPQGDFIYGLKGSQFVVTDNGVPRRVRLEEAPEQTGLSLAVLVQCSGAAALESAKFKGLATMIENITGAAPHEVAVLSFGAEPTLLTRFTSDPVKISAAVSAIQPCRGGVATLDAVEYATHMLDERDNHYRRAILLISETRDHGSHATAKEVIAELGRTNTVVNTVAYSPARDQFLNDLKPDAYGSTRIMQVTPLLFMAINAMRDNASSELATLSGGEYFNVTTRKAFDQALGHLANQLHNFYLLSFQLPNTPAAGYHALRVSVPGRPDVLIRNRTSYWSEPVQPPSSDTR